MREVAEFLIRAAVTLTAGFALGCMAVGMEAVWREWRER